MKVFIGDELQQAVSALPQWQLTEGELVRTVWFPDFTGAIAFVNLAAGLAEKADHHPDIDIRYNKLRLALATHSAGGITQQDLDMAGALDAHLK